MSKQRLLLNHHLEMPAFNAAPLYLSMGFALSRPAGGSARQPDTSTCTQFFRELRSEGFVQLFGMQSKRSSMPQLSAQGKGCSHGRVPAGYSSTKG